MDIARRLLVAMHPRDWRRRYGEEFTALLEDTRLTPAAVADVVAHSVRLHVRAHLTTVLVVAAALLSTAGEVATRRAGLSANILWAPTNEVRALALLGTTAPWIAVIALVRGRRRQAVRGV